MKRKAFTSGDEPTRIRPPYVDDWILDGMKPEDNLFAPVNGAMIAPISAALKLKEPDQLLDRFFMTAKRSYAKETGLLLHFTNYLNYFEKFYDTDKELLTIYTKMKVMIDSIPESSKDNLEYDLRRFILFNPSIGAKIRLMNIDNFRTEIKEYKNDNKALAFTPYHSYVLMEISLFQILIIPIISHYAFKHQGEIGDIIDFLVFFFRIIIEEMHPDVNILGKITETVMEAFTKNFNKNTILWAKQPIQGNNFESLAINCIKSIIVVIMPKYEYYRNSVVFNQVSIRYMLKYTISDGKYDYELNELNHDNYDEDNNSDLDKFEAHLSKKNESLFLHNRVNYEMIMKKIEQHFGPFRPEEIKYYITELSKDKASPINELQKELVFNLFYKYFGDTAAIKSVDIQDYIKLILAAKKLLHSYHLYNMEAIVSGKVVKNINRININKKELIKIQSSNLYKIIENKYKNEKIINQCLSLLATLLASKFQVIDYDHPELTGQPLSIKPDMLNQEFLEYISMV